MHMLTKGFFFTLVLFICLSCSQGDQTNAAVEEQVVTGKEKVMQEKKARKMRSKQAAQNKSKDNYWQSLEKALGLEKKEFRKIKTLNKKNNERIQTLRTDKPSNLADQIKEIRMSEKEIVSKMLGEELYQKKMDHDKKWAEANSPKAKKGMR